MNPMPPKVVSVECRDDYVLAVTFDTQESGLLDMKPYLNIGVFRELCEPGAFQTARVAWHTIRWKSDIDLNRNFVYEKCVKDSRRD